MDNLTLDYTLNVKMLTQTIEDALKLDDNEQLFNELTKVSVAKKEIEAMLEKVESIEKDAKGLINSKAKALYGADWQAIAGKGYKITRSATGSVYARAMDVPVNKKFIELKEVLLTKVIDAEIDKTGKLPKGIEINPSRGESIRITIK